jgi:hypothetical protein
LETSSASRPVLASSSRIDDRTRVLKDGDTFGGVRPLNLGTNHGSADILVHRHPEDVAIQVLRRRGDLEIVSMS